MGLVAPVLVGISECLLGRAVRYDGTDAASEFPLAALAGLFEYRGMCPEVGIGMSVPREPIALFQCAPPQGVRVQGMANPTLDVTEQLRGFAGRAVAETPALCGYVFMKNSPSCGLHTVKVHEVAPRDPPKVLNRQGRGEFARELTQQLPLLPVVENDALFDALTRQNFASRVYALARWRQLMAYGPNAAALTDFHARYKYLLLAHSVTHYRSAGQLLGRNGDGLETTALAYLHLLLTGLAQPVAHGGHVNVLQHLQGYLRSMASADEIQRCQAAVAAYAEQEAPLSTPLDQLKKTFLRYPAAQASRYVLRQYYFAPYPAASGMGERL